MKRYIKRVVLTCGLAIVGAQISFAQDTFTSPISSASLVHSNNAHEYKSQIPVELYSEVRAGNLILDVVKELPYQWNYGGNWQSAQPEMVEFTEGGKLSIKPGLKKGALFDVSSAKFKGHLPETINKILWNSQAVNWMYPVNRYRFVARLQQEDKIFREIQGTITRLYNWRIDAEDKTGQLFRENIEIQKPDALNKYTWLTFRFFGNDEDIVWVYSPIISKARELTGSNRSDLLAGTIAADDFMLWSSKQETLQGKSVKKMKIFVPFAAKNKGTLKKAGNNCWTVSETAPQPDKQTQWNFGSRKYAQGASWMPTDAIFVPRDVYKIDLISNDPYSLSGRQTLYVDAEMLLPVYRFVYDRAGKFWKSLIMLYGLASNEAGDSVPYYSQMIILDNKNKRSLMLDYYEAMLCDALPDGFDMSSFNPHSLEAKERKENK